MAEEKKAKRDHLKKQEVEETRDGKYIHHHTYTPSRDEEQPERHRRNVAVSDTPEEAGQHVAEQFGMNEPPDAGADPGAQPEPAPDAGGGAAPPAGGGM